MVKKEKEKIEVTNEKEIVPILLLYSQDGELTVKLNETDIDNFDLVSVYGHLKLYLKKIEAELLIDDEEEED